MEQFPTTDSALFVEKAAAFVLIATLLMAFVGLAPPPFSSQSALDPSVTQLDSSGDTLKQIIYVLLFLLTLTLVWQRSSVESFSLAIPGSLALLLSWCWMSVFWSDALAIAARRMAFTTIVVLTLIYIVRILNPQKTLDLLFLWLAIILLGDWLVIPLFPGAIHQAGELDPSIVGAWRGLQNNKNDAGAFCAMAELVFLHQAFTRRYAIPALFLAIAAAVFLLKTESKTSMFVLPIAVISGWLVEFLYRHPALKVFAGIAFVAAIVLAYMKFGAALINFVNTLGDDPSEFTGRTQIWAMLVSYSSDHFLLGSGYGAFWAVGDASPALHYGSGWVINVPEAHNGYLDVLVQTGIIGLCAALIALIMAPLYWLLSSRLSKDEYRPLLASIVVFFMLHNLQETSFVDRDNEMWIIFLVVLASIMELRGEARTPVGGEISLTQAVS